MAKKEQKVYTVGQINTLVKVALEEGLPSRFSVVGQISDYKRHFSGHCYFSLKDESGILPGVMWKGKAGKLKFEPENGLEVVARGHIEVYTQGGKYQFYVDSLQLAGVGDLQLAYEQMVKRLKEEGLFDDDHKKAIPLYPMRIGIITSATGAAVKDIATSVYDRWPCVKMALYPATVQGDGAAATIATAIKSINKRNDELKLDVLIVGRGGGSLEDLWAFNEEAVARAIYNSKIPIISAVGHEVDTTIADLVADARASTPTKAGVIAVPDMQEVLERIDSAQRHLERDANNRLEVCKGKLEGVLASAVFRNPLWVLNGPMQRLDEVTGKLNESLRRLLEAGRRKIEAAREKLLQVEPHRLMGQRAVELGRLESGATAAIKSVLTKTQLRVNGIENDAEMAIKSVFAKKQLQITALENRLSGLNPKSVLNRGYSITVNKSSGKLVSGKGDVEVGDVLVTELADKHKIESEVKKK